MSSPDGAPSSVSGGVPGSVPGSVPGRDWYARPVLDVARDLLGATLTRRTADGVVSLHLTEVEAYDGATDPGSHAYRGRTRRNATMFGEPGRLYVYRHLGLHHCVNVVCGPDGEASAVLLRAGEVVGGADLARSRRLASGVARTDRDLARGPARLAVALGLDLSDDGADVTAPDGAVVLGRPLAESRPLADPVEAPVVRTGPRVGVSGDGGRADLFPWRLWLDGEPTVSVYRAAPVRT
ncbi:DNA-3-methyladenine glycosylase [Promicromonospora iranensis]|uniref:Putative 3-methyladenine DNA glycosylase n=1 Tax=Promicromonospora iranensis TaxID=1105144 RepID=A0ABU2CIZ0_9MICO|nr:DNA-3-methyladenine glycosylase [Promicromonospora iranensis]MDR7381315.1 DNA-3-methyladenine glycosylase [Promicromonospora iranensis]